MTTRRGFNISSLGALASRAFGGERSYADEYPDMLLRHLAGGLNRQAEQWDRQRASINTAADLETRNAEVRRLMLQMLGPMPERCPLSPRVVRSFDRHGYRVENVMFQSRPDFRVTASLYIPTEPPRWAKAPYPGIICPCGHYPEGRTNREFQSVYIHLALAGFVVLGYDPIGQGERRQYWNPHTGQTEVGGPTTEHSMPGQVLLLMGENLTAYRVWDGMRAIDYLITRKEVDPERIGCAGHSGGGTLTRFIAPLDSRVKAAVNNEGGTVNRWPVELRPEAQIGPSDVEQNLFPSAKLGVDHVDMQVAVAPRPLLCLIENFSPQFNEAASRIRERYRQLGAEDRFAVEEATDPHAWTPKLRLATSRWFSRWFYDQPGPESEPDFETEPVKQLYCTPNGSIRYSKTGETIFSIIRKKAERLPPRKLSRDDLKALIRLPRAGGDLGIRHLVTTQRKGYAINKVEFLSEPEIYIPAWVFLPAKPDTGRPPIVWIHETGKEAEGLEFGRLEQLARAGRLVIAADLRGLGATRPPHTQPGSRRDEYTHLFDIETAMSYMAWYMDQSLFGMRVFDVLRTVDYALSRPDTAGNGVTVLGHGAGALWALAAGALDGRIQSLTAERMLLSYRTLTLTDRYTHNASGFIKDVLLQTDLPQIAAMLAPRRLTLVEPLDAMKRPIPRSEAERAFASASNVAFVEASESLKMV